MGTPTARAAASTVAMRSSTPCCCTAVASAAPMPRSPIRSSWIRSFWHSITTTAVRARSRRRGPVAAPLTLVSRRFRHHLVRGKLRLAAEPFHLAVLEDAESPTAPPDRIAEKTRDPDGRDEQILGQDEQQLHQPEIRAQEAARDDCRRRHAQAPDGERR